MDLTPTCTIGSYGVLSLLGTLGCGAGAYSSRRIDRSISCHLNVNPFSWCDWCEARNRCQHHHHWVSRRLSTPYEPIVTTTRNFVKQFSRRSTLTLLTSTTIPFLFDRSHSTMAANIAKMHAALKKKNQKRRNGTRVEWKPEEPPYNGAGLLLWHRRASPSATSIQTAGSPSRHRRRRSPPPRP